MSIYDKIQKIREDCQSLDWTPDKKYPKGKKDGITQYVDFVSIQKLKRQVYPLFTKHKTDINVDMTDVCDVITDPKAGYVPRVRIRFVFTLTDTEDGSFQTSAMYGEGSTDDAKCEKTALSYATSCFFMSKFGIVQGNENEDEIDTRSETMSALSERAIPEIAEKPVKTNEEIKEVFAPVQTPQKPADGIADGKDGLSPSERKASDKAIQVIEDLFKKGIIPEEQYNRAESLYSNANTSKDVFALLQIKRDAESNIKGGVF